MLVPIYRLADRLGRVAVKSGIKLGETAVGPGGPVGFLRVARQPHEAARPAARPTPAGRTTLKRRQWPKFGLLLIANVGLVLAAALVIERLSGPAAVPVPAAAPALPKVYNAGDVKVLAPIAMRQALPPFTGKRLEAGVGALEVIIDERGFVEAASMRETVSQSYDRAALEAVTRWRYRPATLDGVPVKFRKLISINIKAN